jgi:outer membrane murein-binding lipoprotein Lpp
MMFAVTSLEAQVRALDAQIAALTAQRDAARQELAAALV